MQILRVGTFLLLVTATAATKTKFDNPFESLTKMFTDFKYVTKDMPTPLQLIQGDGREGALKTALRGVSKGISTALVAKLKNSDLPADFLDNIDKNVDAAVEEAVEAQFGTNEVSTMLETSANSLNDAQMTDLTAKITDVGVQIANGQIQPHDAMTATGAQAPQLPGGYAYAEEKA